VRLLTCALAATLVVAAASGCGGDEDGAAGTTASTPTATTPQPATTTGRRVTTQENEYARPEPPDDQTRWSGQVDAACELWQARIDAVAPPADPDGLERWLGEALPLVRKQVAAVEAVRLPAAQSEAEPASRLVQDLRRVERALTRYQAAVRTSDADAAQQALAEAGAAGAEARTSARALGVTQCGGYSTG
jgi:hypothetical protein